MDSKILQQSLAILTELYGEEIADYVRRVAKAEAKSVNLEPEEVISIAYIVLERTKEKYDASRGNFKNYAIRSLKNELIRSKMRDFMLYDDSPAAEAQQQRVSTEDSAFSVEKLDIRETVTEHEFEKRNREKLYFAMSAALLKNLSPLEKSLVYVSYFSTDSSRVASLKDVADATKLSQYALVSAYRAAMLKLKTQFQDEAE